MNIQELATSEITRLIAELNAELRSRAKAEKSKLVGEIRQRAAELNIPIEDILRAVGQSKRYNKGTRGVIKPKYRNPDDAGQTWSGRGHRPKWIVAQLNRGLRIEDMLIADND